MQGNKERLGYHVQNNETNKGWERMFSNLKTRGVEKVHLFISDGHKSIKKAIRNNFPDSKWQRCLFHVVSEMSKSIIGMPILERGLVENFITHSRKIMSFK